MRRDCLPCLVDDKGKNIPLERIEFSDKSINEGWLQQALHETPDILPVDELDSSFSPLVSVGREILNIDNLYISPAGRITIVETKLWRNPEATRKVIAQILDYANTLNQLSYEQFEEAASKAKRPAPLEKQSLYELVSGSFSDAEELLAEAKFIDAVQKNLKDARFMLLIVGDGIKENVESMVELLHQQSRMLFTFGLIELQVFQGESIAGKLIVPQIIAHTNEIVRAVVKIEGDAKVSVSVESEAPAKGRTGKRKLSESEFFDQITNEDDANLFKRLLTFADEINAVAQWRASSVSIRMLDPYGNSKKLKLTLFVMDTAGTVYFWLLKDQLAKAGVSDGSIACKMVQKVANLYDNVNVSPKSPDTLSRSLTAKEIDDRYDDFTEIIQEAVDEIENASSRSSYSTS